VPAKASEMHKTLLASLGLWIWSKQQSPCLVCLTSMPSTQKGKGKVINSSNCRLQHQQ